MSRRRLMSAFALVLCLCLASGAALAQGVQTATLTGTVTGPDGSPLPGVTVTAASPGNIGERSTQTNEQGTYILRGLTPGLYTVKFAIEGMQPLEVQSDAKLGVTTEVNGALNLTEVTETIVVTSDAVTALGTTTVGNNYKSSDIDLIPSFRTPTAVASLAGGVNDSNTPVANQVQINGGLAYDNAILVNGVNVMDPIFGTANNLFIEGAIQETQVLTSGVSAEYGQFTGGVINVVTKSGGNEFAGGARVNFSKADWRDETPFEDERNIEREGTTNEFYEATFGGYVLKDHLWFFLAGRDQELANPITLGVTGNIAPQVETNTRYEVKFTGAINTRHSLQVSYIDNPLERTHELQVAPIEIASVATNSERVNDGFVGNYTGSITNNLFVEAQYSEKVFTFVNIGGTSRDIHDSPMRGVGLIPGGLAGTYNAPYFDSTDPEDRNNDQLYGAASYYLATDNVGTHDLKAGLESFTVTRTGGNSQSATSFVFLTDFKAAGGSPVYDANGELIPVFTRSPVGGTPFTRLQNFIPTRGAELDVTTDSIFINDRWTLNDHWSFNLGIRHEMVDSEATGNIFGIDTDTTVPRLGAMFDPKGDGTWTFDATYSEYSGRYNPSVIGTNGPVGNPALVTYQYVGPTGEGTNFAPAFDLANYVVTGINVPTANVFFEDDLSSPVSEEFTVSAGRLLPKGGYAKFTYIDRELTGLVDDFITIDQGCTTVTLAGRSLCVDNRTYANTDVPQRSYEGFQLQGRYRITNAWTVDVAWTHQLENEGNYEGEGGQAIGATIFGDRPEMGVARNNPVGRFDDYQHNRIRLWTAYQLDLGKAGGLDFGMVYRYDSPQTFSYTTNAAPSAIQNSRNPGYRQAFAGGSQTIFFGDRGIGEFNKTSLVDFALTYSIALGPVEPWIKFDVTNALNSDTLRRFDTTVTADPTSALDSDGLRTGFIEGTNFGKATVATQYVQPREYFFSVGLRF